jgi:hypothetical protein
VSRRTTILLVLATLVCGLLAGADVDRTLVAMPAWQQVGPIAWAEFSRHADLGNGLVFYPLIAIGGMLLTWAATVSCHFDRSVRREVKLALYAASALEVAGLLLTIKAAPIMLGIRHVTDPAALQQAFAAFRHWGDLRGLSQLFGFVALTLGLGLSRRTPA